MKTKTLSSVLVALTTLAYSGAAGAGKTVQGDPVLFEPFMTVAEDSSTGRDHSLVTVVLSGGVPLTAIVVPIGEADKKQLAEARRQDAMRLARRAIPDTSGVTTNACPTSTTLELIDVDLLLDTSTTSVWQLTYANGAQQVMTINKISGDATFGPIVGGSC